MSLAAKPAEPIEQAAREAGERRSYPVAIHLGLFAAGILVPVLAIVAFMLLDTARLWRADLLHDANLIAQHLNATIEVELQKAIAVSETLATALALDEADRTKFEAQARDVASRLGVNVNARDLAGQQIANTFLPPGTPLPPTNESLRAIDRLAAERRTVVISDLRTATVRNVPTLNVDVPVIIGSKVTSFISASIPPDRFRDILAADLPEGWIAGLVGRDGRLIARNVDQDRYLGTANPDFMSAATGDQGYWAGKARDGTEIAGVYIRSPLSGWIVSVAVPETILRAPARTAMMGLGGLVIASMVVSSVLGWRLSRRISLPIRDLVARAREVGGGRLPVATRSPVTEVNEVTEALRAAAIELDHRAGAANQAADAIRANEEHLQFLLREISHRSKNLLAVIQAMAGQTAKSAESVDVFRRRFGERLMGMAASHDLLVSQNWMGASVEDLVRGQLAPFVEANDPRVRIHGPRVDLKAEATEALGLALHELATNSLKYGALGDPAGTLDIFWDAYRPDRDTSSGDRRFRMDWVEHTAVPVPPPNHKGFGRMVIEHTVEASLGGAVTLLFPPEGMRWRIDAPATLLAPSANSMAA